MANINSRYYIYIKSIAENKVVKSYAPYIFTLITITILVVFAIRPATTTILNLQKDIANQQSLLKSLNEKAQSLTEAKKNYHNLDQSIKNKINQAVPIQAAVPTLIKNLEDALGKQGSASAIQVQPVTIILAENKDKTHPELGNISFTLNIESPYQGALLILSNLTKLQRVVSIDSVSLSKQQEGPIILSINGKAYFLK